MTSDTLSAVIRIGKDTLNAVIQIPQKTDGPIDKIIDTLITGGFPILFAAFGGLATVLVTNYFDKKKNRSLLTIEFAKTRSEDLVKIIREYRQNTRTLFEIEKTHPDMDWHEAKEELISRVDKISKFIGDFQIQHGSYLDDQINEELDEIQNLCSSSRSYIQERKWDDGDTADVYQDAISEAASKYGDGIYDRREKILKLMQAQLKRHLEGLL